MKRFIRVFLPLVLAWSSYGFAADVTVKILLKHADGSKTAYEGSAPAAEAACGIAFRDATAASVLKAGDVVKIPAGACKIGGNPSDQGNPWPSDVKIVGEGRELTTIESSGPFSLTGKNYTFQDLTVNFSCGEGCAEDAISFTGTGTLVLKNVNLNNPGGGGGGPSAVLVRAGNAVLDHANIVNGDQCIGGAVDGNVVQTITIRDSTLTARGNNVLQGGAAGTTWNIYHSVISNSTDGSDQTLAAGGTVNLYEGTSVNASPDLGSIGCGPNVHVYPGVQLNGSSKGCTMVSAQNDKLSAAHKPRNAASK
jgi:hypothetical protein